MSGAGAVDRIDRAGDWASVNVAGLNQLDVLRGEMSAIRRRSLVVADYVPDAGDVVWLHFDPQVGNEQAGHRPALVLSPARYNAMRGMMIACPMRSRIKGYVFEVVVSRAPPSVVLADQLKTLDWRGRRAALKERVSPEVLAEATGKIRTLLTL